MPASTNLPTCAVVSLLGPSVHTILVRVPISDTRGSSRRAKLGSVQAAVTARERWEMRMAVGPREPSVVRPKDPRPAARENKRLVLIILLFTLADVILNSII